VGEKGELEGQSCRVTSTKKNGGRLTSQFSQSGYQREQGSFSMEREGGVKTA